jgi:hypothetical protein
VVRGAGRDAGAPAEETGASIRVGAFLFRLRQVLDALKDFLPLVCYARW